MKEDSKKRIFTILAYILTLTLIGYLVPFVINSMRAQ